MIKNKQKTIKNRLIVFICNCNINIDILQYRITLLKHKKEIYIILHCRMTIYKLQYNSDF